MHWQQVLPDIWMFRDSCNLYALIGNDGAVIVDAGTGRWLESLHQLPVPPKALLLTHFFRDHAAGAVLASRAGIPVYAPEYEATIITDPVEHHRRRETTIIYDNVWDHFAPIEGVPLAGVLRDYDHLQLCGLDLEVVPLPGVTMGQSGIAFTTREERSAICCAEAIHSPGKLARLSPLQYRYNDLTGAVNCYASAQDLRDKQIEVLLPSLGEPMLENADETLSQLQQAMRALCEGRPDMTPLLDSIHGEQLKKVTDHVWQACDSCSVNWFLISESGKAWVIDYGYRGPLTVPSPTRPHHRRALLHSLEGLKKKFGIEKIDVVLVSHFHDDHVCGIPVLQRLHGTKCWAAENFADLLEHPDAHCFPCDWPVPARVDKRLRLDEPFQWEEYSFHLASMNGHTRFASLIGFEADGKRFAHTGDQYFFTQGWGSSLPPHDQNKRLQNHVYRNGALLDGFDESGEWMLKWRPDIVLQGHQDAFFTDEAFFHHIEEWTREYKELHQRSMPLGDDEAHFNVDSWAGWIWPYHTVLQQPGDVAKVRVTVRNPFPREADLKVTLVGPSGWEGSTATLRAEARAEVSTELTVTPHQNCYRRVYAVELEANSQPFGQVAEALLTVVKRIHQTSDEF